jgi:hypothetical protein
MRALTVTHNNQTARTTKVTEALDPARTGSFTKLVSAGGDDQTCPSRNSTATGDTNTLRW